MAGFSLSRRITPFTRFLIACSIGGTIFYITKTYLPQIKATKAALTNESKVANGTANTPTSNADLTPIYDIVDQKPEFATGETEMFKYLRQNLHYPAIARENSIEGKVFVHFVINIDSTISDIKVLKGIGGGCDEETIRVFQNMPKWKPGQHQGKIVKTRFTVPVSFKLD